MIVLNVFGKIEKTCISEKLKLFISNLPKGSFNNWNGGLVEEMKIVYNNHLKKCEIKGYENKLDIRKICRERFPSIDISDEIDLDYCFQLIADHMIYLFFDYEYTDMPLGDWTTNCFDGRLCEVDYAGKILCLFEQLTDYTQLDSILSIGDDETIFKIFEGDLSLVKHLYSIYSSDDEESTLRIFSGRPYEEYDEIFQQFKSLIDNFINDRNDYLFIEYICNALFCEKNYDESHLYRLYSLCQLFLEKEHEYELDNKLPEFLNQRYTVEERENIAQLLRQMRNKIAHGDFIALEAKIEEYAQYAMDGRFWFDYSEYSRKNWALSSACGMLAEAVKKLLYAKLTNRQYIENIKNSR